MSSDLASPPDAPRDTHAGLIDRLAGELRPVGSLGVAERLLLGVAAGAAVSAGLVSLTLGLRPDMAAAAARGMFWVKLAYTLAFAALGVWSCERLARPGNATGGRLRWLLAPLPLVAAAAVWRLAQAPAAEQASMVMGASARVCPWLILGFSLPPLAGLIWALRGLAPTRLRLTGLATGLAAGGTGAAVYALHCPESALPFLAVWYSLGVLLAGAVGGLLGPRLLRW